MGVAVYRALDNGNGPDSFDCTDCIQIMNAWNPHPLAGVGGLLYRKRNSRSIRIGCAMSHVSDRFYKMGIYICCKLIISNRQLCQNSRLPLT
jgi:hypothetical protein